MTDEQEIVNTNVFVPWVNPGDELSGDYLGAVPSKYSSKHLVVRDNGDKVYFYGTALLDQLLAGVPHGDPVRIRLERIETTKKGRRFFLFKVFTTPREAA